MNVRARCDDCGWRGFVRTGWVEVEPKILASLPKERISKRGSRWYYRRRLRDLGCAQCGQRNLHAGRTPEARIGDPAVAMGRLKATR